MSTKFVAAKLEAEFLSFFDFDIEKPENGKRSSA